MIIAGDRTMKRKHATARLALPAMLGCLLGVVLIFTAVACRQPPPPGGGEPRPECTTDEECPEGQICQDGVCVAGPVELRFPYRTTAFEHAPHTTDYGLACADCHHAEPANAARQACNACHADEWIAGVPKLKEAMHTTTGEETGNSGCRSCHAQTTEDGSWQCSFCHTELNDL